MTAPAIFRERPSLVRRAASLVRDRGGVAAVEFALVVPILLCMYFMTMEIAQGIETNKKVARIGSMVGDLITQQTAVSRAEVNAILQIGEATVQPYNRSDVNIEVAAIQLGAQATPVATVMWSRKLQNGVLSAGVAKNTVILKMPPKLRVAGGYYIRVRSTLDYRPVVLFADKAKKQGTGLLAAFDNINMGEEYYLAPRRSDTIPCADC